ncbi:MAG: CopD family protein [Bdellovibrionales bacterium]|nr:CopD family protein [Ramlibacter sp.]
MYQLAKLLHLAAAIVWMGGMFFMLWVLRPVVADKLLPPARAPLMAAVLAKFFLSVWASIAVITVSGAVMLGMTGMKAAPLGQHLMLGAGLLMFALFAHIYFGPFRRVGQAVAAADWPAAGIQMGKMQRFVVANFVLGWLAIAAVVLIR